MQKKSIDLIQTDARVAQHRKDLHGGFRGIFLFTPQQNKNIHD